MRKKREETDEGAPPESEKETPNFGFVTDKDITQVSPHKSETHPRKNTVESEHELPAHPAFGPTEQAEKTDEESQERSGIFAALPLQKVSEAIGSLVDKLPLKSVPFGRFRENKLFLIIPLIVVLLLGLALLYVFTVKATVTLSMESKHIAEGEQITFSPDSSLDFAQKIIPAKEVEVSLPGTKTTDATGKKEVGDKAEGTVTLYNNTSSPKSLPAGSVITSSNDLDFVTDKDVTIASASGDIFSGTKPGTAKVDVTAKDIGSEYNLPSNTKFTVSSSSSLAAKNDSAFSGGTKKNITVVSKNDQSKLVEDLPKSLEDKAKDELAKKLGEGEIALPGFIDEQVGQKKYSKDLNDEADNVTLQATVTFTALTYKKADMKELAQSLLKDTHSQELAISTKGVQTTVKDIKPDKNDDDVSATLAMEANLLPKINTDSLLQQLPGKSFAGASNLIRQKDPQVKNIDITLSPNIPFLPKLLPLVKDHITITISANE